MAGSLRQLKAQGQDDLLRDRFDSVFRRNLVELDAPTTAEKKRQRKRAYKFKDRQGTAYGSLAEKLDKKNKKLKEGEGNEEESTNGFKKSKSKKKKSRFSDKTREGNTRKNDDLQIENIGDISMHNLSSQNLNVTISGLI